MPPRQLKHFGVDNTPPNGSDGAVDHSFTPNGEGGGDGGGDGGGNSGTANTRRPHRKSRNGCIECKRRHIRCDERRPSCANCAIAERECSFPPPKRQAQAKQKHRLQRDLPHSPIANTPMSQDPLSPAQSQTSLPSLHFIPNPIPTSNGPAESEPPYLHHILHHQSLLEQESVYTQSQSQPHLHASGQATPYLPHMAFTPISTDTSASPISPRALPMVHDQTELAGDGVRFTAQHLQLLYNASHALNKYATPGDDTNCIVDIAIKRAVDAPYLIDQILAITALHMASKHPESAASLRHQATELQTRAVISFTRLTASLPVDDIGICVPRFLFAAILSLHVMAETLTHHRADFSAFIDRFVECIHLHRGVRVVIRPTWDFLQKSELRPLLSVTSEAKEKVTESGTECDQLHRLIDHSDLSEASTEACRDAIRTLQLAFDIAGGLPSSDSPHAASSFSVMVGVEYVDVLRKRRPEALVILAYYGVLMHRARGFWVFADAGACVIRAVSAYLGALWHEPMKWPLQVLEMETD